MIPFILLLTLPTGLDARYSGPSSMQDTILIKQYLDKAKSFDSLDKKSLDSTLFYINRAQSFSKELSYSKYLYDINKQFVHFFTDTRNYSVALEYAFRMMTLLDDREDKEDSSEIDKQYIGLYTAIGIIYFNLGNFDKSLDYLRQAEKIALESYKTNTKIGAELCVVYNDIGSIYLQKKEYDAAQQYYEKALSYNRDNKSYSAALYNNIGIICMEQGNYNEALEYYNKSLDIRKEENDVGGIAQVYNNMGKCYYHLNKYDQAIVLLEDAMQLHNKTNNYRSEIIGLRILSDIYNSRGNYKREALLNKRESELKDSLAMQENMGQIVQLEAHYEYEKQRKEDELEQQILLAEKEKKTLIFIMTTGILSLSFFLLILFYRNLKIKAKRDKFRSDSLVLEQKNLELEKQNLLLQNSKLEQEVENKTKELTTHVMYLVQKNEFIDSVTKRLSDLTNEESKQINKQRVNTIIRQMKANVDKTAWDEFEIRFQQIHQDFYTKLNERVPNLTTNEKRLCAFLYLNMTTKEISAITFQSIKSIEVARTRLRRKMQLDKDNLISVLQSL